MPYVVAVVISKLICSTPAIAERVVLIEQLVVPITSVWSITTSGLSQVRNESVLARAARK